jgi:hypothetical protein
MKKIAVLIGVFVLFSGAVSGQSKKFVWEDEICAYEGTYNASLYTKKQLENTYRLWYSQDFEIASYQASFSNPQGLMERWTIPALDAEYAQKSAALMKLEIVNVPYWKNFKAKKLKALEEDYLLARLTVEAFENPTVLKQLKFADACIEGFANPLIAGGDDLLRVWREINEKGRKKGADSPEAEKYFEEKLVSTDKFKYARAEVLTFGWWNCVNARIERGDDLGVLHKNFRKLFKRTKELGCDYA